MSKMDFISESRSDVQDDTSTFTRTYYDARRMCSNGTPGCSSPSANISLNVAPFPLPVPSTVARYQPGAAGSTFTLPLPAETKAQSADLFRSNLSPFQLLYVTIRAYGRKADRLAGHNSQVRPLPNIRGSFGGFECMVLELVGLSPAHAHDDR